MKIVFDHPATARLNFVKGDELTVERLTPELEVLLGAGRLDGSKVCHVVGHDRQTATTGDDRRETATTERGGRRGASAAAVSA